MSIRKCGKSWMLDVLIQGERFRKVFKKRGDAIRIHQILSDETEIFQKVGILERIIRDLKAIDLKRARKPWPKEKL